MRTRWGASLFPQNERYQGVPIMIDRRTVLGMVLVAVPVAACAKKAEAATLTVYRSPYCGCCRDWVRHIQRNGFGITEREMEDVTPVARKLGVPDGLRSCHTAEIGGYFVEGHVPPSNIKKLLRDRPNALGIAVPGMPLGSPGMDQGNQRQPFDSLLVARTGKASVFARHNQS